MPLRLRLTPFQSRPAKLAAYAWMMDVMAEEFARRSLHRLIYHSRFSPSFPKAEEDQDHEIGRIIQASVRNNRLASLTGMLLVRGDQFLQVLEGPTDAVKVTYARILSDRRHLAAKVLAEGRAEDRQFGDWNMCAHRLSKADDAILATLDRGTKPDLSNLDGASALRLLKAVREVQASTLARGLA